MNHPTPRHIAMLLLQLEQLTPERMSLAEALQRAFDAGKIAGRIEGLDEGHRIGTQFRAQFRAALDGIAQDIQELQK